MSWKIRLMPFSSLYNHGLIIRGTSSILSLAKSTCVKNSVGLFSLFSREKLLLLLPLV